MTDVPRTSLERPIICSQGRSATRSRRRPRLELLNICSSCKKQKQICNIRTITSEKQFFHKIINFCIGPLRVPWKSRTLGPLEDLQGTSTGRRVPAGCFLSQSSPLKCILPENSCEPWLFYSFKVLIDRFNNLAPSGK